MHLYALFPFYSSEYTIRGSQLNSVVAPAVALHDGFWLQVPAGSWLMNPA